MAFTALSLACAGACLGSMGFFGAVIAPTVFGTLGEAEAGRFVRSMFPRYYAFLAGVSGVGAAGAAMGRHPAAASLLVLTCAAFVAARQVVMPRVNAARDAAAGGDEAAQARFNALHRASVVLNGVQGAALLVAAVLLGS